MYINPIINVSQSRYRFQHSNAGYERKVLTNPIRTISFTGDDYFKYDEVLKKKLESRTKIQKFFGLGKKKAKEETDMELIGFNLGQNHLINAKEQLIKEKEKLLLEKEKTIAVMKEKNDILTQRIEDAKKNHEKDKVILDLKRQLEESQKQMQLKKADYVAETKKFDKLKREQEILTRRENGKGWNKIAGYEALKTQMEESFINKLALEKAGFETSFPNGILLYGQHGTGKTRFAEAFAQQAGCEFVAIDTLQDDDDIIMDLKTELKKSKKRYNSEETPKKRTIILLDDFNSVAQLSETDKANLKDGRTDFEETNVGQLAELLEDCASKYKATIFMTTNHPRKIDSELLNSNLIPYQIFLGPPNPTDAAKIFKYHTEEFTNQDIDYNKLGYEVSKVLQSDEAYSAQGIVNVVENAKEKTKGSQITETDLMNSVHEVKPDITTKVFNDFLDDMAETLQEYMQKNGAKKDANN